MIAFNNWSNIKYYFCGWPNNESETCHWGRPVPIKSVHCKMRDPNVAVKSLDPQTHGLQWIY